MATTDNGWLASPTLKTRVIEPVRGVRLRIVDNQNVADVFTYLIKQFHTRVDDVTKPHPADDWGFHFKMNANSPHKLSRHSGGIAIDLDATEHPNSVATAKTYSAKQIAEVHKILSELEGTVRWGGDYTHTADGMHFEIQVRPGELQSVASKIRRGKIGPPKPIVSPPKRPRKKAPSTIANEVIAGKWGNGPSRKARLVKAGYNYTNIQKLVKEKISKK